MSQSPTSLSELYYDTRTGLRSAEQLYYRARELGLDVSRREVHKFYKEQATAQQFLHRPVKAYYALSTYSPWSRVQADLLDVTTLAPLQNGGTKFLFNLIDVYSRTAFSEPMKSKSEAECSRAFKIIINKIKTMSHVTPYRLDVDKEAGITGRAFKKYCKDEEINITLAETNNQVSVIERFNRTLRMYLQRYKTAYKTRKYIDVLPAILRNYNSSYHQSLQGSPDQAVRGEVSIEGYIDSRNSKANKQKYNQAAIAVGSMVRVLKERTTFEKGTESKWSSTIHEVTAIEHHQYHVTGRVKAYLKRELQLVKEIQDRGEEKADIEHKYDGENEVEEEEAREREERRAQRRLAREGMAPHRYSGRDPDNSLEYRQRQEVEALGDRRSRSGRR